MIGLIFILVVIYFYALFVNAFTKFFSGEKILPVSSPLEFFQTIRQVDPKVVDGLKVLDVTSEETTSLPLSLDESLKTFLKKTIDEAVQNHLDIDTSSETVVLPNDIESGRLIIKNGRNGGLVIKHNDKRTKAIEKNAIALMKEVEKTNKICQELEASMFQNKLTNPKNNEIQIEDEVLAIPEEFTLALDASSADSDSQTPNELEVSNDSSELSDLVSFAPSGNSFSVDGTDISIRYFNPFSTALKQIDDKDELLLLINLTAPKDEADILNWIESRPNMPSWVKTYMDMDIFYYATQIFSTSIPKDFVKKLPVFRSFAFAVDKIRENDLKQLNSSFM